VSFVGKEIETRTFSLIVTELYHRNKKKSRENKLDFFLSMLYNNFMRNTAALAAKEAGKILLSNLGNVKKYLKSKREFVTAADRLAEKKIYEIIKRAFSDHSILAEEFYDEKEKSAYRWIIDPLDGTNNYVYSYPFFAVSIALEKEGEVILGIVYDPLRDELFEAEKGRNAKLNGKKIEVTQTSRVKKTRLLTGFPYFMDRDNNLNNFVKFAIDALEIRVGGSAALDLCYVACGRADGYWELGLKPWDTAAGKLIVECASGKVTDIDGKKFTPYKASILATNGRIHEEMLKMLSSTNRLPITDN